MSLATRPLSIRLRAALHRTAGRLWFGLRNLPRARYHLELLASIHGEDFDAQVRLGRVAHAQGDYRAWRRACRAARDASPERFAALSHPFPLFDGSARSQADLRERDFDFRAFRSSVAGPIGTPGRSTAPADLEAADCRPASDGRDDCRDEPERQQFQRRGPILGDELARVDLDELARRLVD